MSATLHPINSARIQSDPVTAEQEIEARYFGDDMDDVCAVAIAVNDPVLIANAALPLKNRRAAALNWRKKQVLELFRRDADFQLFHDKAAPELRESIRDGELALYEIAQKVSAFRQELEARRQAARMKSKANLRASVLSALRDSDGTEERLLFPGFLAILETGEIGLFRNRAACVAWARASGVSYVFGSLDQSSYRVHPGIEVD